MQSKKSQVSAEFIIIISVLMIIFIAIISSSKPKENQLNEIRAEIYAAAEAEKLAEEISAVYLAGDGASKEVVFPSSLREGSNYHLTIYPISHLVLINYSSEGRQRAYSSTIVTAEVSGNISMINSAITLRNINGVVTIEK
mgnify:CR=1 FL=1